MNERVRKPIRLDGFDYSKAKSYFVTICTKEKFELFGTVGVGASGARPNNVYTPTMHLSETGKLVEDELKIPRESFYKNVNISHYVVMPNHVHMIVTIIGQNYDGRAPLAPTLSRIIQQFKGAVSKKAGYSPWQNSFHDRIIRVDEYESIVSYINNNVKDWETDKHNPKRKV